MKRLRKEAVADKTTSRQSSDIPQLDLGVGEDKLSANGIGCGCSGVGIISTHSKCRSLTFLALAAGAIFTANLGLLKGTFRFGEQNKFPVIDERCEAAARLLKQRNIHLLALDFDLTVIDRHTGGRWKGTSKELSQHVRPEIHCLLNSAFNRKIDAAIVTFSEQIELISNVTQQIFPKQYIPVHGWYTSSEGKQGHLVRAMQDINEYHGNAKVTNQTTILIDDDKRNIKKARKDGYETILYDPEGGDPMFLVETIRNT